MGELWRSPGSKTWASPLWLELVKALTGPAALLGLIVTIWLGIGQLRQSQRSRDDERFDRAVARLASASTTERVAGVVGLQLFLVPDQGDRHRATLQFLSNALVSDAGDATEREAIMDTFGALTPEAVGHEVLNATLETVRDKNRRLFSLRRERESKRLAASIGKPDQRKGEASGEDADLDEDSPLGATASAIALLIRRGARTGDLSGIYCAKCDFSGVSWDSEKRALVKSGPIGMGAIDLSRTSFRDADLTDANFTMVNLQDADLEDASIGGAVFYRASLRRAKMTSVKDVNFMSAEVLPSKFPDFSCADLNGADFTNRVFFGVIRTHSVRSGEVLQAHIWDSVPILRGADLAHAKLERIRIFVLMPSTSTHLSGRRAKPDFDEDFRALPFEGEQDSFSGYPLLGDWSAVQEPASPQRYAYFILFSGADLGVKEPVRDDDIPSMYGALGEFAAARNVEDSDLPHRIREFIHRNRGSLRGGGGLEAALRREPCGSY